VESRISYGTGFNIQANNPAPGSFFGLASGVPALLRGRPAGMTVSALIRPDGTADSNDPGVPLTEFAAGTRNFAAADEGWQIILNTAGDARAIFVGIGDNNRGIEVANDLDMVVTMVWDAAELTVYVNGVYLAGIGGTLTAGPDSFGIGGTPDPSWLVADPTAGGLWRSSLAGLWVTPDVLDPPAVHDHFEQVQLAQDMRAVGVGGNAPSTAAYLWSVRRGLPQLVDQGTETWVDEVQGLSLARIGTPVGASVGVRRTDWDQKQTSNIRP